MGKRTANNIIIYSIAVLCRNQLQTSHQLAVMLRTTYIYIMRITFGIFDETSRICKSPNQGIISNIASQHSDGWRNDNRSRGNGIILSEFKSNAMNKQINKFSHVYNNLSSAAHPKHVGLCKLTCHLVLVSSIIYLPPPPTPSTTTFHTLPQQSERVHAHLSVCVYII